MSEVSPISGSMKVVEISEPGGPEVLTMAERPVPAPGPGQVLIQVDAAGVNRPDCLQRAGLYPPPPDASDLPGLEVAGTVVASAADTAWPHEGDRVCALTPGGGYAQYCPTAADHCLPVPGPLSTIEAAALPETYFTVWANLFQTGGLTSGETVLVHGGASGIGSTAVSLARAFGARVFATAGSQEKCRFCEDLGAERCFNYRESDFAQSLADKGEKIDVVLDIVGRPYLAGNLKVLNYGGRLVMVGVLGGARAEIDLRTLLRKRLTVTGSTLRPRPDAEKAAIARELRDQVWPLLEAGRFGPRIQQTFTMSEASKAHELLEANQAMGKVVLTVSDSAS